ncbi:MAG: hypothetical protein WCV88_04585 [Patescibacteria group bacterium]|jgi:hypothetical protein
MKHLIILLLLIVPSVAFGFVYSSTYEPKLFVYLDQEIASSAVVVRAHREAGADSKDVIYPCYDGQCLFNKNSHPDEDRWTYFIERLDKTMPTETAQSKKASLEFYQQHKVTFSINATKQLRKFNFTATTEKIDHVMHIDTTKQTLNTETVDSGAYKPDEAANTFANIGGWNFSPSTIRVFGAVAALIITYVGFKLIPIGGHH